MAATIDKEKLLQAILLAEHLESSPAWQAEVSRRRSEKVRHTNAVRWGKAEATGKKTNRSYTTERIMEETGVSSNAAEAITKVIRMGRPDLLAKVKAGEMAIETALQTVRTGKTRPKALQGTKHVDSKRIVDRAVVTLEGLCIGVGLVNVEAIEPTRAAGAAKALNASLKKLKAFVADLESAGATTNHKEAI